MCISRAFYNISILQKSEIFCPIVRRLLFHRFSSFGLVGQHGDWIVTEKGVQTIEGDRFVCTSRSHQGPQDAIVIVAGTVVDQNPP